MRAAPPVSVRCTGGLVWRGVQAVLPALAAGVLAWWCLALLSQSFVIEPGAMAVAVSLLIAVLTAASAWRQARQPGLQVAWDGQSWSADGGAASLDVMIDLGGWLLLRLRPLQTGRWCWIAVSAADAGPALHALRTALYSRPPENTPRVRPERTAD